MDWQTEIGACPDCGAVDWQVVESHDSAINFLCLACGACWFHSMGWLTRVDPNACPGCAAAWEAICRGRQTVVDVGGVIERRRTYAMVIASARRS
ncbi:MAG: hypothetical protein U0W40_15185 [Acidimicrobiia bacterium]